MSTGRRWAIALLAVAVLGISGYLLLYRSGREPVVEELWTQEVGRSTDWNVVLVTIDTLRADRLGCYGNTRVETPHLDRLAREGIRFQNASTTVPFTLPAHSSMMTGTYPPYHGVRENVGYRLDESLPTMAELMASAGRTTAGFVSTFVLDSRWGIARGFHHYFDDFDLKEMGGDLGSVQRDGRETVAAALDWLDGRPPGPFFLWLHLYDPHDPYEPPEPFRSRYPGRPYEGEVAYADSLLGRFYEALEEQGLLERTLLVVTGDHGEGLRNHDEGFHGFFVYDSTARIPLIFRLPGRRFAGRVVKEAVSHVDLLPTILEALERPIPPTVQGRSLLPLLLGREEAQERAVYSESLYPLLHYGWAPVRALRTTRYKYIEVPRPELYDLVDDPGEERNLLAGERRLAGQLRERLRELRSRIEAEERGSERADLDEETLAQLRALGYVAGRGEAASADDGRERADPKDKIELHQRIMMAQSALGKGETDVAEARLREVLELDAKMIDPYQMLGQILLQRKDFEGALADFQKALELDGDHRSSLFGLAQAYDRLGRQEEALVGFERLVSLDPGDSKAALAAARILVEQERLAEAREVLERAAESSSSPALLENQLGEVLVLEGRGAEAKAHFERAVTKNGELAQPRFNLAVLYEEEGQDELARRLYEEVIERAPKHYQAQFNLGRLVGRHGDTARQQELYEAAVESNPDFIRGYYFLAKLLMDQGGDLRRAEELTRQGLARDPEHHAGPLGYYLLADILNRTRRPAEARQAVEKGREIERRHEDG